MRITREENESFNDDGVGIGQLDDGSLDTFPLSEWPKRKAMRDATEAETEKAFAKVFPDDRDPTEVEDLDDVSDLDD
jgi:hypothetical protein